MGHIWRLFFSGGMVWILLARGLLDEPTRGGNQTEVPAFMGLIR